jgi:hypothetical protein
MNGCDIYIYEPNVKKKVHISQLQFNKLVGLTFLELSKSFSSSLLGRYPVGILAQTPVTLIDPDFQQARARIGRVPLPSTALQLICHYHHISFDAK